MANRWYRKGALFLAQSALSVAPGSFNFKAIFLKPSYLYDATDEFVQDLDTFNNECVDTVSGSTRKTLAGLTVTIDHPNNRVEVDCQNPVLLNANCGTIGSMVIYKELAFESNSLLIAYFDEGFPYVTFGETVTIVVNPEGLLQLILAVP